MLAWQLLDGEFTPCDSIPIEDRGFRYGMSVFESFRVVNGHPLFLDEHIASLRESCMRVEFDSPGIPSGSVRRTLGAPLLETGRPAPDGLARFYVTAGEGDAGGGVARSKVILFFEERAPMPEERRTCGYTLAIDPERHSPLFGGLKTANYWSNLSAFARARRSGGDETVLLDQEGRVLSASLANLFIVRGGRIETPPAGSGARAGIVRAWVLARRAVHECTLKTPDLEGAEEIFLTGSWFGIMPVASLEDRTLPSRATALGLQSEYHAEVVQPFVHR